MSRLRGLSSSGKDALVGAGISFPVMIKPGFEAGPRGSLPGRRRHRAAGQDPSGLLEGSRVNDANLTVNAKISLKGGRAPLPPRCPFAGQEQGGRKPGESPWAATQPERCFFSSAIILELKRVWRRSRRKGKSPGKEVSQVCAPVPAHTQPGSASGGGWWPGAARAEGPRSGGPGPGP